MLYRYSEIFRTTLMVSDLMLVAVSWALAYWIRFHTGWPAPQGTPGLETYAYALAGLVDWSEVSPLPFELACVPQRLYHWTRMPVVSYAVPARYFISCLRGIMLQGRGAAVLWPDLLGLTVLAVLIIGACTAKFKRSLD